MMRGRAPGAGSHVHWPMRAAGLATCAALAWASLTTGMARTTALSDPERALLWSPHDARALALLAATKLRAGLSTEDRAAIRRLACEAIRRDPTIVVAVRTLGLLADDEGDRPQARTLLTYAQTLSRHDLPTQAWFIEERVAAEDVPGALVHFDIALRSSAVAEPMLVPVLLGAIEDPVVRARLVDRLTLRPAWRFGFIAAAIRSARSADAVGALAIALAARGQPIEPKAMRDLLARLVRDGAYATAAAVRATAPGGGDPRSGPWPHDGGFDGKDDLPPFDWVMAEESGLHAEPAPGDVGAGAGAKLAFGAESDRAGEVARQLLMLPPGRYRFSTRFAVEGADALSRPVWQIACTATPTAPALRLELAPARAGTAAAAAAAADFTIPASDCAAQWLALRVPASQGVDGIDGWVDDVAIRRRP